MLATTILLQMIPKSDIYFYIIIHFPLIIEHVSEKKTSQPSNCNSSYIYMYMYIYITITFMACEKISLQLKNT